MNNTNAIRALEESMSQRTQLIGSYAPPGDRVAAFIGLSSQIHSNPELATQFAALRTERRQWERLHGMKEIDVNQFLDNFDDMDDELFGSPEEVEKLKNSPAYHAFRYVDASGETANPEDYEEKWFAENKTASYRRAVLTVLEELGGSAPLEEVVPRIEPLMRHKLNAQDYQTVKQNENLTGWEVRARYTRFELVTLGWMKADSAEGIWEISAEGREARLTGDLSTPIEGSKGKFHD